MDGATNLISALLVGIASNKAEKSAVEKATAAGTEIVEAEVVDGKVVEVEEEK